MSNIILARTDMGYTHSTANELIRRYPRIIKLACHYHLEWVVCINVVNRLFSAIVKVAFSFVTSRKILGYFSGRDAAGHEYIPVPILFFMKVLFKTLYRQSLPQITAVAQFNRVKTEVYYQERWRRMITWPCELVHIAHWALIYYYISYFSGYKVMSLGL